MVTLLQTKYQDLNQQQQKYTQLDICNQNER